MKTELNISIGKEPIKLTPVKVLVKDVKIENVPIATGIVRKVVFIVSHPESKENLSISKAKYQAGDRVEIHGTWYRLDDEGNVPFNSSIASVMRYYDVETLGELVGISLETATDEKGFLVIKAI